MLIFTALSNNAIQGIMSIMEINPGGDDYFLFLNSATIIKRGVYTKNNDEWRF